MLTLNDRKAGRDKPAGRTIPIEWLGLSRSAAVEALIRSEAARLEAWSRDRRVWKVRVHAPEHPHSLQDGISVSIEVRAPERQVIVSRADADAGTALRETFAALFRHFERRVVHERRARSPGAASGSSLANRRAARYAMLAA